MHNEIFDPRRDEYKTPYGAVKTGTRVSLTVKPPRILGLRRVFLCAEFETSGASLERALDWRGAEGGRDVYCLELETRDYIGLVWYRFRLERPGGDLHLGKTGIGPEPAVPFQLTVYGNADKKASWFGKGVTYQIFPDRFYRLAIPEELPKGKEIHENWSDMPLHGPKTDERGRQLWNYDFFGGSISGITAKLDYLRDMGVNTLYLNPIFEAFSNHRYDTGDYEKLDPLLGGIEDFELLCQKAREKGMRVILDGVFSHTGSDSRYFNREGIYGDVGAFQSENSPYYKWYDFERWPDKYAAWWGVETLPEVNEAEPSYVDYIIENENSIIKQWLRHGADGWRLDVADELPDAFIDKLYRAAKEEKRESVIIGEVWEDASNKISYGLRRRHLLGQHLDGVMNYPFRTAAISYVKGGGAERFKEEMETIRENYPKDAFYNCMNFLGTHDTPRILTVLSADEFPRSPELRAAYKMSGEEYKRGKGRLKIAALLMFAFPGSPTVYYGDEAGVTGFDDPFNRRTYPWDREDGELLQWFKELARIRNASPTLQSGGIEYLCAKGGLLAFSRSLRGERIIAAANAGDKAETLSLPWRGKNAYDLISCNELTIGEGHINLRLSSMSSAIISAKRI